MTAPRRRRLLTAAAAALAPSGCLRLQGGTERGSTTPSTERDTVVATTQGGNEADGTASDEPRNLRGLEPAWDHGDVEPGYLDEPGFLRRHGRDLYAFGDAAARIDLDARHLAAAVELRDRTYSVAVRDGVAFVGEMGVDTGALQRVNLDDGEATWTVELDEYDRVSAIAVADDAVYFAGTNHSPDLESALYRADRADGTVRRLHEWSERAQIASMTAHEGTLFLGFSGDLVDDQVYDAAADEVRALPFYLPSHFAVVDGVLYGARLAVDLASEERVYDRSHPSSLATAVHGDVVVSGSRDGVQGVDRRTGEELWFHGTDERVVTRAVTVDGVTFAGSREGTVYGFDLETGRMRHTGSLPGVDGDRVFTGEDALATDGDALLTSAGGLTAFGLRWG